MSDINVTVQDEIVNIDVLDTPVLVNVVNSPGQQGPAGPGVPVGGTAGQVLAKNSSTNYDTVWVNQSGGVPYSGATGNVNLGEYELKAGQVTLDTSPTGTAAVGTIRWNDTTGTSETTLKGGNVIIKNGVDLVARVVNKVTPNSTLTKAAYQAVRVSGAQGQRLAVALAQANNDTNSADTIGLVTETIAPNQEGFIMTMGQLENINTTGSLQGETWADGDVLYLSPTTAGALTNIKPTAVTGHIVVVGYVEYAHVNNGKIYVKVMNGWELDELHNVSIITPTNNQGIFYNSSNSLWENKTISTALGYTPVPTTRNITINGVTYDLSADRTYTISTGISGSGASGQVTYWTGASSVSGSNNLFWDNANGRLGIGFNAPANDLQIQKSVGSGGAVVAQIINTNSAGEAALSIKNDSFYVGFEIFGSLFPTTSLRNQALFTTQSGVTYLGFATLGNAPIGFRTNTTLGTTNERLTILGNGNVAVNSTSDLGVRFGVVGDTLLRGSGATSATTALTVQNSASATMMSISNDAANTILNISGSTYSIFQANQTTANRTAYFGTISTSVEFGCGTAITNYRFLNAGGYTLLKINTAPFPTAGGDVFELPLIGTNFAPTSGSANLTLLHMRPNINQTGGANGITRGVYVNPTLTAAADWRSIQWDNNTGWGLYGAGTANNYLAGNLGIAVTPNAWTVVKALQIQRSSFTSYSDSGFASSQFTTNAYYDGSWRYVGTGGAAKYDQQTNNIAHFWSIAPSGTVGNAITFTQAMTLFNTGNLSIGTASDLAVRLGVVGDTLLRGSGATSATTALTVQNSSSTNLFTVRNDGLASLTTNQNAFTYLQVINTTSGTSAVTGLQLETNGGAILQIGKRSASTTAYKILAGHDSYLYNTVGGDISILNDFATGQIKFAAGGASTAHLTIKSNGRINMSSLPTSATGLAAGDLWNDAGTVKIV